MKNIYATLLTTSALLLAGSSMAQSHGKAGTDQLQTLRPAHVRGQLATHGNAMRGGGAPANDECSAAQALTLVPTADCGTSMVTGNNGTSTISTGDPTCDTSTDGYQDVWYSFNSDTNSVVTVNMANVDGTDWAFTVQTTCDPGAEIACEINPAGPIQVNVTPNTDYYIRVFANTDFGVGGEFTLCVSFAAQDPAPVNDDCTGAVNQDLAAGSSVTFTGDNTGATTGADSLGATPAVWEMFTTTECTNLAIAYCGTTPAFGNAFANLFIGCPFTDFVANSGFDATSCTDGNYTIFYTDVPAGTYYYPVMMDPANDAVGPYTITVSATACATPPANDECAGAIELTPATDCVPVAGTTAGATQSMDPILCNGYTSPDAKDVWYSFTATETEHTVIIEGIGNFDAVMELFSGSCADLTSIVCGDPTFPNPDPVTEVTPLTGLTVGVTYYLRVYDYAHGSTDHNFNICITTGVPPAQYCVPTQADPTDGDFIANVTLGAINNTTAGDNNYEDYTAQSTMLEQGGSYTLSITSGTYGEDYFAAWIDYNVDTTFQVTEKLGEFAGTTPGELIALSFTVPADATLGTTRLRVRCAWDEASMDPCAEYSFGEIEDYHVEITIPTGVREVNTLDMNVYPNPTTGDVTISGADLSGSVEFELTDMTGRVVYSHQQSMSAGRPVTLPLNGKLAQGTYTLRLISANGISSRPVMIK